MHVIYTCNNKQYCKLLEGLIPGAHPKVGKGHGEWLTSPSVPLTVASVASRQQSPSRVALDLTPNPPAYLLPIDPNYI